MSLMRQILADSPAVYFPLDDAASPLKDRSGNGRDLSSYSGSGTYQQAGPSGLTALDVHAGRWALAAAGTWQVDQSHYTLEGWFMWNGTTATDRGMWGAFGGAASTGVLFWFNTGNVPSVWHGATQLGAAGATMVSGAWEHLALVWDGTTATYYRNLGVVASATLGAPGTSNTPAQLSGYGTLTSSTREFPGSAAHVIGYDTALSLARLTAHYRAGRRSGVVGP